MRSRERGVLEAGALPSMGMGWVGNRPIPVGRPVEEEGPLLGLYTRLLLLQSYERDTSSMSAHSRIWRSASSRAIP
jgi:hypothetical protein